MTRRAEWLGCPFLGSFFWASKRMNISDINNGNPKDEIMKGNGIP